MRTRYSVCMDGKPMHDIDPSIYIVDISEQSPSFEIVTAKNGGRDGSRRINKKRRSLSVSVRFMVHEYNTQRRKEIFGQISAWAKKGSYLTVSDRPCQRLRVVCDAPATVNSSLKWTGIQEIAFTAYELPYWEDEYSDKALGNGTQGNVSLFVHGSADETYLAFSAVNVGSDTLHEFTAAVNDTKMHFTSLNIPPSGKIEAFYDEDGYLHIPMANRTPDSSDDLLVRCGTYNSIAFSADQNVSVTFTARGRYE